MQTTGNPILPGWYADPELHWFQNRFYLYPTFSAPFDEQTTFDVWSSSDLANWTRDGVILDFADVPWSTNRAAWAPSVAEHDGRYFIYFSAGDGAGLGVATADHPNGPFADPLGRPLIAEYHHGAQPIDAHAFVDDGKGYLYYGGHRKAVVVCLGDDMTSLSGPFVDITPESYVEGPFMLKRDGIYYFMWSEGDWGNDTYRVAYAMSDSPYGPFQRIGAVLQNNPAVGNAAGHHSVLRLPGTEDYVIAYHRRPLGETDPHHRVVCLDELRFNPDGSIAPVMLTHTGPSVYRGEFAT